MKCTEVRCELKVLLRAGDYGKTEHITLTATIEATDENESGDSLMAAATKLCMDNCKAVALAKNEKGAKPSSAEVSAIRGK